MNRGSDCPISGDHQAFAPQRKVRERSCFGEYCLVLWILVMDEFYKGGEEDENVFF